MARSARRPLSREQFHDALCKGFGRAMLHVRRFGAKGLEDEILHACLHCLVHDPQLEGTRGTWLFKLLKRAAQLDVFCDPILAKLKNATFETVPSWDACQLMALACGYARQGSKLAYQIIYEKFGEQLYEPAFGGQQIVTLDGLSGFLHVAEVVGARLKREVDFRDDGYLLWLADDEFGEERVTEALRERSQTSSNVAAFEYLVNQQRATNKRRGDSGNAPTLSDFLAAVEHDGDVPWLTCSKFARHATAGELDEVFARLLRETETNRILSYLWVFSSAKLPRLDDRVFELAWSEVDTIRNNAITALAQVKAPAIRELGLRLLEEQDVARRKDGIALLSKNHKSKDIPRIAAALPTEGPPEVLHGMATKLLCSAYHRPRNIEMFNWVYEYNPCSYCRYGAFRRLAEWGALTKFQLVECAWDGYDETRISARRIIKKRRKAEGEST